MPLFAATGRICRFDFADMVFHLLKLACLALASAIMGLTRGYPELTLLYMAVIILDAWLS